MKTKIIGQVLQLKIHCPDPMPLLNGSFYDHDLEVGFTILQERGLVEGQWQGMNITAQVALLKELKLHCLRDLYHCSDQKAEVELVFRWALVHSMHLLALTLFHQPRLF